MSHFSSDLEKRLHVDTRIFNWSVDRYLVMMSFYTLRKSPLRQLTAICKNVVFFTTLSSTFN
jgi:hypothetical protein